MSLTACNFGSHNFVYETRLPGSLHIHTCSECGAAYTATGSDGCYCAPKP